jgi:hypothetical protein
MRIWLDADNSPHVLILRPIAEELQKRGHEVKFTARDRAATCELMDMYGLAYTQVGGEYPNGKLGKILGTLNRAWRLYRSTKQWQPDVSFGHGSRALPIASWLMKVPSVTMYDYEWVNPTIFNRFCSKILLPDCIDDDRCREAGIDVSKVQRFPGFKEELYLANARPDPAISQELGLREDKLKVLLRPPATRAHYHEPEAERILEEVLKELLARKDVQLILIPRSPDQRKLVHGDHQAEVIIPERQYDGPGLILASDVVIGGGGTMTREAAILGLPSASFFKGRLGRVDEKLQNSGNLYLVRESFDERFMSIVKEGLTVDLRVHDPLPLIIRHALACDRQDRASINRHG